MYAYLKPFKKVAMLKKLLHRSALLTLSLAAITTVPAPLIGSETSKAATTPKAITRKQVPITGKSIKYVITTNLKFAIVKSSFHGITMFASSTQVAKSIRTYQDLFWFINHKGSDPGFAAFKQATSPLLKKLKKDLTNGQIKPTDSITDQLADLLNVPANKLYGKGLLPVPEAALKGSKYIYPNNKEPLSYYLGISETLSKKLAVEALNSQGVVVPIPAMYLASAIEGTGFKYINLKKERVGKYYCPEITLIVPSYTPTTRPLKCLYEDLFDKLWDAKSVAEKEFETLERYLGLKSRLGQYGPYPARYLLLERANLNRDKFFYSDIDAYKIGKQHSLNKDIVIIGAGVHKSDLLAFRTKNIFSDNGNSLPQSLLKAVALATGQSINTLNERIAGLE